MFLSLQRPSGAPNRPPPTPPPPRDRPRPSARQFLSIHPLFPVGIAVTPASRFAPGRQPLDPSPPTTKQASRQAMQTLICAPCLVLRCLTGQQPASIVNYCCSTCECGALGRLRSRRCEAAAVFHWAAAGRQLSGMRPGCRAPPVERLFCVGLRLPIGQAGPTAALVQSTRRSNKARLRERALSGPAARAARSLPTIANGWQPMHTYSNKQLVLPSQYYHLFIRSCLR